MPKKIKVVDVVNNEVQNEEPEPSVIENNEINNTEVNESVNDPVIEKQEEKINDVEEVPKPKAKVKSRAKPKPKPIEIAPCVARSALARVEEPVKLEEPVKIEEPKEEIVEETKPNKVKKVVELVKCEKCNKMMTQKSLRYSHEKMCKGQVVDINELPVKRRAKKEPTITNNTEITNKKETPKIYTSPRDEYDIPDDVKKEICRVIARNQLRMKAREDNLNKLKITDSIKKYYINNI